MRVLITRPAGQEASLRELLAARAVETLHMPMLAIEAIDPLPAPQRQRLLELDRYAHLIFISSNAARVGLARIDDYWPQYPAEQTCWAVGDSTAAILDAAGLLVRRPGRDMRSEALLAMPELQAVRGERILIVKGAGGRDLLKRTLLDRGAQVDLLECYRRVPPPLDAAECRESLRSLPVQAILISSGEGLENLSRLLTPQENTNFTGTALIVPSQRVADRARALGWHHLHCAENASDGAMVEAVCALKRAEMKSRAPS